MHITRGGGLGSLVGGAAFFLFLMVILPDVLRVIMGFIREVAPYVAAGFGLFFLGVIVLAIIRKWLDR